MNQPFMLPRKQPFTLPCKFKPDPSFQPSQEETTLHGYAIINVDSLLQAASQASDCPILHMGRNEKVQDSIPVGANN